MTHATPPAAGGTVGDDPDIPQPRGESVPVRLQPCGDGGYRLTVGGATVCLSEKELALLGRAIHVMAGRRPGLLQELIASAVDGDDGRRSDQPDRVNRQGRHLR